MIIANYNNILNDIISELQRANEIHPKFHSFHEFYGVLMEEVEELFDEIKKKQQDKERIRQEAIQVAAMVFKMIDNLIDNDAEPSALNEIENAMERWHHARDNDSETLEKINDILVSIGKLQWFNNKK